MQTNVLIFEIHRLFILFRFLEWDYGSDLGYLKGQLTQVEAAQALSTLEKLAIGNYSEYLKDSDENRADVRDSIASRERQSIHEDTFVQDDELRMRKFADSLILQRQIREQERVSKEKQSMVGNQQMNESVADVPAQRKLNLGAKSKSKVDHAAIHTVSRSSPKNTEWCLTEEFNFPEKWQKDKLQRSYSLSDFKDLHIEKGLEQRSNSNIQLSGVQSRMMYGSGPSSSSSCGTVITNRKKMSLIEQYRCEDQELPSHLEDIIIETELDSEIARIQSSKLSLHSGQSSKQSIGNSFETVISTGNSQSRTKDQLENATSSSKSVPRQKNPKNNSEDKMYEEQKYDPHRGLINSGNSSLPSTSDEDVERRKRLIGEDTSTMESVDMIDRAKSFEYIPGESFPLQENSSSYEYLPGNLIR